METINTLISLNGIKDKESEANSFGTTVLNKFNDHLDLIIHCGVSEAAYLNYKGDRI